MSEAKLALAKEKTIHYTCEQDLIEAREMLTELGDYQDAPALLKRCDTLRAYLPGKHVEYGALNGEPLRWKVCDVRGKMRLLICDTIPARHAFQSPRIDTYWSICGLRAWLNSEFLKKVFTPAERLSIMQTRISNPKSEAWVSYGGPDTADKLFILSPDEAVRYFPRPEDRRMGCWWWLRCPGSNLLSAMAVYEDGTLYDFGINVNYGEGGVRPAMWVLLKA